MDFFQTLCYPFCLSAIESLLSDFVPERPYCSFLASDLINIFEFTHQISDRSFEGNWFFAKKKVYFSFIFKSMIVSFFINSYSGELASEIYEIFVYAREGGEACEWAWSSLGDI